MSEKGREKSIQVLVNGQMACPALSLWSLCHGNRDISEPVKSECGGCFLSYCNTAKDEHSEHSEHSKHRPLRVQFAHNVTVMHDDFAMKRNICQSIFKTVRVKVCALYCRWR